MRKAKKPPPPSVQFAKLLGDHGALSRLGRYGAMMKKEYAQKDRERITAKLLKESREMRREANEHICPID